METQYLDAVGRFACVAEKPKKGWFDEVGENATPCIIIVCKVIEGQHAGKSAIWKGWLTDKAFDRTIARLTEVFGFDGDLKALHAGTSTFAGMHCGIETEPKTLPAKGGKPAKQIVEVAWLNAPGGSVKPLEEARVQSILTKLGSRSKAIAKSTKSELAANGVAVPSAPRGTTPQPTSQAQPAATAEGAPPEEDDVPF